MKNLCEQILENDLNPFLTFDNNGKLNKYNKEAEYLLNFVDIKDLYELAISYATQSFGFAHYYININYNKQAYYALLVGYENENEIALRLYKEVNTKEIINIDKKYNMSNIFSLISLSMNSTFESDIKIKEIYDVSIPEFKIPINEFLLTINSVFNILKNKKDITVKVYMKVGEYEIINNKKYQLICLQVTTNGIVDFSLCKSSNLINLFYNQNKIEIDLALIL
jgi:nitrogen-specific signal transduction histidine kinase